MIDYKKQRLEFAQEVAAEIKEEYDEAEKKERTDFQNGYATGLSIAYLCFRHCLLLLDDIDDDVLNELGVADAIWNIDIKDNDNEKTTITVEEAKEIVRKLKG